MNQKTIFLSRKQSNRPIEKAKTEHTPSDQLRALIDQNKSVLEFIESHLPDFTQDQLLVFLHLALYKKCTDSVDSFIELAQKHRNIQDCEHLTHYYTLRMYEAEKFKEFLDAGIYSVQSVQDFVNSVAPQGQKKQALKNFVVIYEKKLLEKNLESAPVGRTFKL